MVLTLYPLVYTLFVVFLYFVTILLVMLVVWGLVFLHQQESIPKVVFFCLTCSYQQESSPKVVDSLKCFGAQIPEIFPNLNLSFIVIVVVRLCLTHYNRCILNKNIIRCAPIDTIRRPSGYGSRGAEATAFIQ